MVAVVVDDTVVESCVANVLGRLSDVRNNPLACWRSYEFLSIYASLELRK